MSSSKSWKSNQWYIGKAQLRSCQWEIWQSTFLNQFEEFSNLLDNRPSDPLQFKLCQTVVEIPVLVKELQSWTSQRKAFKSDPFESLHPGRGTWSGLSKRVPDRIKEAEVLTHLRRLQNPGLWFGHKPKSRNIEVLNQLKEFPIPHGESMNGSNLADSSSFEPPNLYPKIIQGSQHLSLLERNCILVLNKALHFRHLLIRGMGSHVSHRSVLLSHLQPLPQVSRTLSIVIVWRCYCQKCALPCMLSPKKLINTWSDTQSWEE